MDKVDDDSSYPTLEKIEGIDDPTVEGWGGYPLNAMFVRTEPRTVGDVVKRIERDRYILDPDFQRDFVWTISKQSKLIESCIMRIPLPVFYVAEAKKGEIIVVDGLQRLNTFYRFINNKFRLSGLDSQDTGTPHPLKGKHFRDLPITLQERVEDTPLTMYILDSKAPERARLDIFERVNSGEPLTRQQMRNALYNGPATVWLREAANSPEFKSATGSSLNPRTMRDREAINRFCAFKCLPLTSYRGDMDSFLAEGLSTLSKADENEQTTLTKQFNAAITLNAKLFGEHAFRKSLAKGAKAQLSPINISLFEVCVVNFSDLESPSDKQENYLRKGIIKLLKNENFIDAITYSTNSSRQVRERFKRMKKLVDSMPGIGQ